MPSWIAEYLNAANPMFYPAFGLAILLAGLCMPISADFVLLTAGYLAYNGQAAYGVLIPVAIVAVLLADTAMFGIGRKFGPRVLTVWPFRKAFTPERLARTETAFRDLGYRVVFFARFMPGIRTVFMFTSGTLGLRYGRFLAYDFAGALIVIPTILFSVKWIAGNLGDVRAKVAHGQWVATGIIFLSVVLIFAWRRLARNRAAANV
jgi:membrane protein DedA with SNARE-associated domain